MTQRVTGEMHATTILAVRRGTDVAMAGDGQVTVGDVVMKHTARKIRRLAGGRAIAGFAGSTADALTLFDKFESMMERYSGNLRRAAVELTKEWRTDRARCRCSGDWLRWGLCAGGGAGARAQHRD